MTEEQTQRRTVLTVQWEANGSTGTKMGVRHMEGWPREVAWGEV